MKILQLSIFLENRSGRLSNLINILGENKINIQAMSLTDSSRFGILRLIVNDTDKAEQVLKNSGYAVRLTEVLAAEILDQPGQLGNLLRDMEQAELNIEYMYGCVRKPSKHAVLIFRVNDIDKAIAVANTSDFELINNISGLQ